MKSLSLSSGSGSSSSSCAFGDEEEIGYKVGGYLVLAPLLLLCLCLHLCLYLSGSRSGFWSQEEHFSDSVLSVATATPVELLPHFLGWLYVQLDEEEDWPENVCLVF